MTTKYRDNQQPRQLFLDSLVEFYEKLGDKGFWADTKKQEIALEAFNQDYIRTEHTGYEREDAASLQAAIFEFQTREKYMLRRIK